MIYAIGLCVAGFGILRLYQKLTWGVCKNAADLTGKTAIVTGSNTGIGLEVAKELAARNARVVVACRDEKKGKSAVEHIKQITGKNEVVFRKLDLSSLSQIRKFSEEFHSKEKELAILINNAGVCNIPFSRTADGLEINMATNHFGPFLLTLLLLDMMKKTPGARIVNTSSLVHMWTSGIDLENINGEKYIDKKIYIATKLANVLFTRELSRKLENTGITVNCLHPGTVQTELLRNLYFPVNYIIWVIGRLCFKNAKQGAQTTLHCAISDDVKNITGEYFSDCKVTKPGKGALDDGAAKKLWELSEGFTKCNFQI